MKLFGGTKIAPEENEEETKLLAPINIPFSLNDFDLLETIGFNI